MAKKNGSPAKRNKKRDMLRCARENVWHAKNFAVYAIEGTATGVKWLPTGLDCAVNNSEAALLTRVKHSYKVVCGACYRDDEGKDWFTRREIIFHGLWLGDETVAHINKVARDELDDIPLGWRLTSYYFATPDLDYEFTDMQIWKWLHTAQVFDKTLNWNEYVSNEALDMEDFLKDKDLSTTQVGGNHYSRLTVQPRTVINTLQLPWDIGNAIKYVIRYEHKNGSEDLKKAWDYIARCKMDGLDNFRQRRVLKKHKELWDTFVEQFPKGVKQVLTTMWQVYIEKYNGDDKTFQNNMSAILFDINQLHKATYGTNAY